jgi:hypothetical protein
VVSVRRILLLFAPGGTCNGGRWAGRAWSKCGGGQILDAYEECVLQFGLEATSLEAIADQARIKRSVVRHYMGNRALADHVSDFKRIYAHHWISRGIGESRPC